MDNPECWTRNKLIRTYFSLGLGHAEITSALQTNEGITISLRQLRRVLPRLGLFRRRDFTGVPLLVTFLERQLSLSGHLHGYRWMHLKCLQNGFVVTQRTVRELLQILDPVGVDTRRRRRLQRRRYFNKGPNYLWHTDCYDKLKPFGICITGCIDGYSRYIMWLKAGANSNDPAIIAHHYLETVSMLKGCPQTLRSDSGTENVIIETIQNDLRNNGIRVQTHLPAFLYGKSTANQRIESWWSMLRRQNSQYWLNLFHDLKDHGLFSGDFIDKSLVQFCFLDIVQKDLDTICLEWNLHKITKSRNSISPHGRPFALFHEPQKFSAINYMHRVSSDDIYRWIPYTSSPKCISDEDVYDLASLIMEERHFNPPVDAIEARSLYMRLRSVIVDLLS